MTPSSNDEATREHDTDLDHAAAPHDHQGPGDADDSDPPPVAGAEPWTISFPSTLDDAVTSQLALLRRTGASAERVLLPVVTSAAVTGFALWPWGTTTAFTGAALAAVFVGLGVRPFNEAVLRSRVTTHCLMLRGSTEPQPVEVVLDSDGVHTHGDGTVVSVAWWKVDELLTDGHAIELRAPGFTTEIPHTAFADEEERRLFLDTVRHHMQHAHSPGDPD